jgi:hypothetical protein
VWTDGWRESLADRREGSSPHLPRKLSESGPPSPSSLSLAESRPALVQSHLISRSDLPNQGCSCDLCIAHRVLCVRGARVPLCPVISAAGRGGNASTSCLSLPSPAPALASCLRRRLWQRRGNGVGLARAEFAACSWPVRPRLWARQAGLVIRGVEQVPDERFLGEGAERARRILHASTDRFIG